MSLENSFQKCVRTFFRYPYEREGATATLCDDVEVPVYEKEADGRRLGIAKPDPEQYEAFLLRPLPHGAFECPLDTGGVVDVRAEALFDGKVSGSFVLTVNVSRWIRDRKVFLSDIQFEDKNGKACCFGGRASSWLDPILPQIRRWIRSMILIAEKRRDEPEFVVELSEGEVIQLQHRFVIRMRNERSAKAWAMSRKNLKLMLHYAHVDRFTVKLWRLSRPNSQPVADSDGWIYESRLCHRGGGHLGWDTYRRLPDSGIWHKV